MPNLKVIKKCCAPVGAAQKPSCEVKFYWDKVPSRGRPSLIWCACCCVDRLEGRSTGPCYRAVGETRRCWNCLSQFKRCGDIPSSITAYAGKCRFKDEAIRPHDEGDMLATLKDAMEAQSKPKAVAECSRRTKNSKDTKDKCEIMDYSPQAYPGVDAGTGQDSDSESHSDSGIARRIPYTPVWAYEQKDGL